MRPLARVFTLFGLPALIVVVAVYPFAAIPLALAWACVGLWAWEG